MQDITIHDRESQRAQIQNVTNDYFEKHIDISPRAMAALQGRWCEEYDPSSHLPAFIPSESVFEGLLLSSPSCLLLLSEVGIQVQDLFRLEGVEGPAPLIFETLEMIFEGTLENDYWYGQFETGEKVLQKGSLTELDLFSSFLETLYTGPRLFYEKIEDGKISEYCSDVGLLLLKSASVDVNQAIESGQKEWVEGLHKEMIKKGRKGRYIFEDIAEDRYIALSTAEKYLNELKQRISETMLADPSHDRFQFALWEDTKGLIRISPFGVGKLGSVEQIHPERHGDFVYREGIFQPISSIFPGFTNDAISLLEDMMNSEQATENEFQRFFEKYPEFLTGLEYNAVHPQIVLFSDEGPSLIPDFMLEPISSKFCDLLEIKLPYESLVRKLRNESRVHFRALVNQAISQLTEYRRYFESGRNRRAFHDRYGLEAYNPKMILVIGRKHHFRDDLERRELRDLMPKDLELWTYDDLLSRARIYRRCHSQRI